MNRNVESHFSIAPTLTPERSTFDRSTEIKLTGSVGRLVPFFRDEVLPGDTFRIDTSKVVRLQTPITPIMDNLYIDTFFFFIPRRLVWKHWKEFCGENTESAWEQTTEYTIPQLTAPVGGWNVGTIADYLGVRPNISGLSIDACYFRAYAKVVDDWFRDQNLQDPVLIPDGDATASGSNGDDYVTDLALGGMPFIANRYHDYFTSCLPSPQRGPSALIPVATPEAMPVFASKEAHGYDNLKKVVSGTDSSVVPLLFYNVAGSKNQFINNSINSSPNEVRISGANVFSGDAVGSGGDIGYNDILTSYLSPGNLWAYSSGNAVAATIAELRTAFQIQRFLEKNARSGTRYIEMIKAHFGVTSPDARLQRSEYLGGSRVPVVINQVLQTSETAATPQGTTGAFSLTTSQGDKFTRSFTEHGIILGLMCVRYNHSYQQGVERLLTRKTKFDFYWPVFSHLSEMGVKNREIFAQGTVADEEIFGYQEAWADYRYAPDRVAGQMRSDSNLSLDVWHLADDYNSLPTLSSGWIQEDRTTVDRVLAVESALADQWFADIYTRNYCTRVMPTFSIPGLIDHY